MRTIKKNLSMRLEAQAKEAEDLGIIKVAEALKKQCKKQKIRKDSDFYSYTFKELRADVEEAVWDAIVRVADYYDSPVDAQSVQETVETWADNIINESRIKAGINHGVGAHEPVVPGEERTQIAIEVTEDSK